MKDCKKCGKIRDHKLATTEILYSQRKQEQSQQEVLLFSDIQSVLLTIHKEKPFVSLLN